GRPARTSRRNRALACRRASSRLPSSDKSRRCSLAFSFLLWLFFFGFFFVQVFLDCQDRFRADLAVTTLGQCRQPLFQGSFHFDVEHHALAPFRVGWLSVHAAQRTRPGRAYLDSTRLS